MLSGSAKAFFLLALPSLALLTSCRDDGYFREMRMKQAEEHFERIKGNQIPEGLTLTLPYCIETAIKNNLDLKVSELKEAIERERRTAAYLGMLPEMNLDISYSKRSNEPGGSSINLQTGEQSLVPSKSSEEDEFTLKYEIVFSTLDFGLAYFNAVQQEDKQLLAREQKRRTAQNLVMNVARTYFKVAAAQRSMENAERLIELSEKSLTDVLEMEKKGNLPPIRAAEEKASLLRLKQSLMDYRNEYESACIELRSLMGYHPVIAIQVDDSCMDALTQLDIPEIDTLEATALRQRPELYEANIQRDITVIDARKAILMMFPNVKAFTDFSHSSNKYLYNQSWWEVGVRAAYNLLKLPSQIQQYRALDKETDEMEVKTLALSVAVLAQVRIAHAGMMEARRRYELSDALHNVYVDYLKVAGDRSKTSGDISPLDLAKLEMQAGETSIKRSQTLAQYYLAYYALLNSMGIQSIDACKTPDVRDDVSAKPDDAPNPSGDDSTEPQLIEAAPPANPEAAAPAPEPTPLETLF